MLGTVFRAGVSKLAPEDLLTPFPNLLHKTAAVVFKSPEHLG